MRKTANYTDDAQTIINNAKDLARNLSEEYDGDQSNWQAWFESALKAQINTMSLHNDTPAEYAAFIRG